ncbi:MAG: hypothetical protein ACI4PL_05045 [Faecousia sp.]
MKEPIIEFKDFAFQYFSQAEPTLHQYRPDHLQRRKGADRRPSGSGKSTLGHCINGLIPFGYRGDITGSVTVGGLNTKEAGIFALSKKVGTAPAFPRPRFRPPTASAASSPPCLDLWPAS